MRYVFTHTFVKYNGEICINLLGLLLTRRRTVLSNILFKIIQKNHRTNLRPHMDIYQNGEKYFQRHRQGQEDQHVGQSARGQKSRRPYISSNVRKMKSFRRSMNLPCHRLETKRQEKTIRETSQAAERRHGTILERHDLAEDSAIQANLEAE